MLRHSTSAPDAAVSPDRNHQRGYDAAAAAVQLAVSGTGAEGDGTQTEQKGEAGGAGGEDAWERVCSAHRYTDHHGDDLKQAQPTAGTNSMALKPMPPITNVVDAAHCCRACGAHHECMGWTYVHDNSYCWLKARAMTEVMLQKPPVG